MRAKSLILLITQLLALPFACGEEYRTFSDTQGRKIEAAVLAVEGDRVRIRRADGPALWADLSLFSSEDQSYIKAWAKKASVQNAIIEVSQDSEKVELERFSERKIKGLLEETWKEKVHIRVKNNGVDPLHNLRVEYQVFKFESDLAAEKRGGGAIKRISGSSRIEELKVREEAVVNPEPIPMRETKLKGNYYWTAGGERKSADEIEGVWVKVFIGDTLVNCDDKVLRVSIFHGQ